MNKVSVAKNVLAAFGVLAILGLVALIIWGLIVKTLATILFTLFIGGISLFVWALLVIFEAEARGEL